MALHNPPVNDDEKINNRHWDWPMLQQIDPQFPHDSWHSEHRSTTRKPIPHTQTWIPEGNEKLCSNYTYQRERLVEEAWCEHDTVFVPCLSLWAWMAH